MEKDLCIDYTSLSIFYYCYYYRSSFIGVYLCGKHFRIYANLYSLILHSDELLRLLIKFSRWEAIPGSLFITHKNDCSKSAVEEL